MNFFIFCPPFPIAVGLHVLSSEVLTEIKLAFENRSVSSGCPVYAGQGANAHVIINEFSNILSEESFNDKKSKDYQNNGWPMGEFTK